MKQVIAVVVGIMLWISPVYAGYKSYRWDFGSRMREQQQERELRRQQRQLREQERRLKRLEREQEAREWRERIRRHNRRY